MVDLVLSCLNPNRKRPPPFDESQMSRENSDIAACSDFYRFKSLELLDISRMLRL